MPASLRERLHALVEHEPVFEPSDDPTLIAFGRLFLGSGLFALDADKHLRTGALSPLYDCSTELRRQADSTAESFVAIWTPVWPHSDPVTGFRTGRDSAYLGGTPTVAMPQDERTAALLLLVTTPFVHLSALQSASGPLIQGAADDEDGGYRFLTLAPDPLAAADSVRTEAQGQR
jgi:hypothetical protein